MIRRASFARPGRRWLWIAGALLTVIALLAVLVRFAAMSPLGRNLVESRLEAMTVSGQTIELDGLRGDLFGRFTIDELALRDASGVWLTASDLAAEWRPTGLLGRHLDLEVLEAGRIHISRRPELPPSQRSDTRGSFPLHSIDLGRLAISHFVLDEAVSTRALDLNLAAAASWSRKAARLELSMFPNVGTGDTAKAQLSWTPETWLQGTLDLESPAGGLLASLARLDPAQALTAQLRGTGEIESWQSQLDARIDGAPWIDAQASRSGETGAYEVRLAPALHPDQARHSPWLGESVQSVGTIDLGQPDRPRLVGRLDAERASATFNIARARDGHIIADIDAMARDLPLLARLETVRLEEAHLQGVLTRTSGRATFEGRLTAAGLAAPNVDIARLSGPLQLAYAGGSLAVSADLAAEGGRFAEAPARLLGTAPQTKIKAEYQLADRRLRISSLALDGLAASLTAQGEFVLDALDSLELSGTAALDGPLAGWPMAGDIDADWSLNGQSDGDFGYDLRLRARDPVLTPGPLSQLLGSELTVRSEGNVSRQGALAARSFTAMGERLRLTGEGARTPDGTVDIRANAESEAMSRGEVQMAPISLVARASGRLDALTVTATARTSRLAYGSAALDALGLRTQASLAGGVLSASIEGEATHADSPVSLQSAVTLDGPLWGLADIDLRHGDLRLLGEASGAGSDLAAIRANLSLDGALPDDLPAQAISADIVITGQSLDITGEAAGIAISALSDATLAWTIAGPPEELAVETRLSGQLDLAGELHPLQLRLDGVATEALSAQRAGRFTLSGRIDEETFRTARPASLQATARGLAADFALDAFGGQVEGRLQDDPSERVLISLDGVQLDALLPLFGQLPRRGELNGRLHLFDDGETLDGQLNASLSGLYTLAGAQAPLDISLEGLLDENSLELVFTTVFEDALNGEARLSVPATSSSEPLSIALAQDAPALFSAKLLGEAGPLADLLLPSDQAFAGRVDLDLSGTLPLGDDRIQGRLTVSEGSFEDARAGLALVDLSLEANFQPDAVVLQRFAAHDRNGGTLSGGGRMSLSGGGSSLELAAERLVVFDRIEGKLATSGNLTLTQSGRLVSLGGDLSIVEGQLNLDKLPKGGPATLNVVFEAPAPEPEAESAAPALTALDIRVTAPRGVRLVGLGVEAVMIVDAEVTGSFGDPRVVGGGRVQRGSFDLLGKRFEFEDSTIAINGDPLDADLSIRAARRTNDLTVFIAVTGTPQRPEITLGSEPALPQDEVLSRLLFGRSPAELGTLESARLAAALAQLSGGGGFNLLGGIQESLSLDTLSVDQSTNGALELTTGKYIAEDVYLELRSRADAPPGVALEWQPLDNVEVELETSSDTGQSVSVRWKYDFD